MPTYERDNRLLVGIFFYEDEMELYGRTQIETAYEEINDANVVDVLNKARGVHTGNQTQIEYLYNYYRGKQDIEYRTKTYHQEINNKVCENRAQEIVTFKKGYIAGDPIQYIATNNDKSDEVAILNQYMEYVGKTTKDLELFEWIFICGTGYAIALPTTDKDEAEICPFELYTLDPRNTFVIYSSNIEHKPLAGVYSVKDKDNQLHYTVYTPKKIYDVVNGTFTSKKNALGMIPIVEYRANNARLGAFEIVVPLLNQINNLDSNRMDGVEQFIQSLLVLTNVDIDEDMTASKIREAGMVLLKSTNENKAGVDVISEELNQQQTQTLKDDLYNAVLTICCMPNRNSGNGDSTGIAVVYRDGWSSAETSAKASETMYKQADRELRKVVFKILREFNKLDIAVTDVICKFTRRSYDNLEIKVNALNTMLSNNKIDPRFAYTSSGLFVDSEEAYMAGMKYYEEHKEDDTTI